MNQPSVGPILSIATCPVCGAGLCGIRVCTGDDPTELPPRSGFVMCDECEAVWLEPDVNSQHLYVDPEEPVCPIFQTDLWSTTQWATADEVERLGWSKRIDHSLDQSSNQS